MTPEERFEKIEKAQLAFRQDVKVLNEQMTVSARMQEEAEKRWVNTSADLWSALESLARSQKGTQEAVERLGKTVEHLGETVEHLAGTVEKLSVKIDALADRQTNTQAALDSLIANIDRFIKGQDGNGQAGPKRGRK